LDKDELLAYLKNRKEVEWDQRIDLSNETFNDYSNPINITAKKISFQTKPSFGGPWNFFQ
jgi:hypothetical protein